MKFSIRDLLLVTVIVALAVGWVVERIRAERMAIRVQEATKAAESSQATSMALAQKVKNLEEESLQIRIQGLTTATHLDVERKMSEIYRDELNRHTGSPNVLAPAPNPPKP